MIIKKNRPLIIVKSGNAAKRPGTEPAKSSIPIPPQAARTDKIDTTDNFLSISEIWRSLPKNESFLNKIGAVLQILMRQFWAGSNKAKHNTVTEGVINPISPSTEGIAEANGTIGNENPAIENTEPEANSASNGGSLSAEAVQQLVREIVEEITTPAKSLDTNKNIVDENTVIINPRVTTPCLSAEEVLELIRITLEGTTTQSNSLGENETFVAANPVISNTEAEISSVIDSGYLAAERIQQLIKETLRSIQIQQTSNQPSQTVEVESPAEQTLNQAAQIVEAKQPIQQTFNQPSQIVEVKQMPVSWKDLRLGSLSRPPTTTKTQLDEVESTPEGERQFLPELLPKIVSTPLTEETPNQEPPVTDSPAFLANLAVSSRLSTRGGITTVEGYLNSLKERREIGESNWRKRLEEAGVPSNLAKIVTYNSSIPWEQAAKIISGEIRPGTSEFDSLSQNEKALFYSSQYNPELLKQAIQNGIDPLEAERLLSTNPQELQQRIQSDKTETINPLSSLRFLPAEVSELLENPNIPAEIKHVLRVNPYDRSLIENLISSEEEKMSAALEGEEGEPPTLEEFLQAYQQRLTSEKAAELVAEVAKQQIPLFDSRVPVDLRQVVEEVPTKEDQETVSVTNTANVAEKTKLASLK